VTPKLSLQRRDQGRDVRLTGTQVRTRLHAGLRGGAQDDAATGRVHDEGAGVGASGRLFPDQMVLIPRCAFMLPLMYRPISRPTSVLAGIKLLHTVIWAALVGCILALPVAAFTRRFHWALVLTAVIVSECAVLAANRGRCPLTDWAARYTEDREANFDIYLPRWLARNNKAIFGTLFVVNELIVLWRWLVQP